MRFPARSSQTRPGTIAGPLRFRTTDVAAKRCAVRLSSGVAFRGVSRRLPDGFPSKQDESVGDRAPPAQIIMRTLKFLVKHLVALGAEHIPQVAIRHQN